MPAASQSCRRCRRSRPRSRARCPGGWGRSRACSRREKPVAPHISTVATFTDVTSPSSSREHRGADQAAALHELANPGGARARVQQPVSHRRAPVVAARNPHQPGRDRKRSGTGDVDPEGGLEELGSHVDSSMYTGPVGVEKNALTAMAHTQAGEATAFSKDGQQRSVRRGRFDGPAAADSLEPYCRPHEPRRAKQKGSGQSYCCRCRRCSSPASDSGWARRPCSRPRST